MVKYLPEQKVWINGRFVVDKGSSNTCRDCGHKFTDTHFFRKLSHLRNCEKQSEETRKAIKAVKKLQPLADQENSRRRAELKAKKNDSSDDEAAESEVEVGAAIAVEDPTVPLATLPDVIGGQQAVVAVLNKKRKRVSSKGGGAISDAEITSANSAVANFFAHLKLPNSTIENEFFKEMMLRVRPAYAKALPSADIFEASINSSSGSSSSGGGGGSAISARESLVAAAVATETAAAVISK